MSARSLSGPQAYVDAIDWQGAARELASRTAPGEEGVAIVHAINGLTSAVLALAAATALAAVDGNPAVAETGEARNWRAVIL